MCPSIDCDQYGPIEVDALAHQIINTPEFQRLHLMRQTGLMFMVFPLATHTRFAHSLGVYHLARECVEHLYRQHGPEVVTDRHRRLIPIAGLCCHDPSLLSTRLPLAKEDLKFLSSCIHPSKDESRRWTFQIVTNLRNGIDVDKLDSLNRDAVAFGLPAPLRTRRVIQGMRISQGEIHYSTSISSDLLDVFYHHFRMHRYFYQDTTVVEIHRCVESCGQQQTFPRLQTDGTDEKNDIWLSANIVGRIYEPGPLEQVWLTDGRCLADMGHRAEQIMGLSERWRLKPRPPGPTTNVLHRKYLPPSLV